MGLMGLIGLMGLVGCSEDSEDEGLRESHDIELLNYVPWFVEVEPMGTRGPMGQMGPMRTMRQMGTRAVDPSWRPSGYVDYSEMDDLFSNQMTNINRNIGVYFAKAGTEAPKQSHFRHSSNQWRSSEEIDAGSYYLYGYIPSGGDVLSSASITPIGEGYQDGATLTLSGLNTVTPNDVCVIVGAKEGSKSGDDVTVTDMAVGQFETQIKSGDDGNYLFLLFDHLYSSIRFRFKVDDKYNELRTIKLKKLEMKGYKKEGSTTTSVNSKVNAVIELTPNTTGDSPITSITITAVEGSSDDLLNALPIYNCGTGTPVELTTDYSDFLGCFATNLCNVFDLTSTYDVYDKSNNLVRSNCTATNKIDITSLIDAGGMQRGTMYTVNLTVKPTYLLVLSEPDLVDDDPTIKVD